jgi:hypothetical protein
MIVLTTRQAFDAMILFLKEHSDNTQHSLGQILSEIRYGSLDPDDGSPVTNLPGVWHEWLEAVARAEAGGYSLD